MMYSRKKSIFSLLLISFIICSGTASASFQKEFHNQSTDALVCQGENGFYYFDYFNMMYIEKNSYESIPLCGRIECSHEGIDCNSFFMTLNNNIAYEDDKIYFVKHSMNDYSIDLYAMDYDGTDHRYITAIGNSDENRNGLFIIDQGYVLYPKGSNIYRSKCDGSEEAIMLGSIDGMDDHSAFLYADSGELYVMIRNAAYGHELYWYTEGQFVKCWTVPGEDDVGAWSHTGVSVNGWYISDYELYMYLSGNGIWSYDLAKKEYRQITSIADTLQAGYAVFSDEAICVINTIGGLSTNNVQEHAVFIYDYNGNQIKTIPISSIYDDDAYSIVRILGVSDEDILLYTLGTNYVEYWFGEDEDVSGLTAPKRTLYAVSVDSGEIIQIRTEK